MWPLKCLKIKEFNTYQYIYHCMYTVLVSLNSHKNFCWPKFCHWKFLSCWSDHYLEVSESSLPLISDDRASEISNPALLICGEHDCYINFNEFVQKLIIFCKSYLRQLLLIPNFTLCWSGFPQLLKNHWNSDLFQDHGKIIEFWISYSWKNHWILK